MKTFIIAYFNEFNKKNFSDTKRRMDEYVRCETDGLKSNRTRDKYERSDRSRARRPKSEKERSPVHSHRYVIVI